MCRNLLPTGRNVHATEVIPLLRLAQPAACCACSDGTAQPAKQHKHPARAYKPTLHPRLRTSGGHQGLGSRPPQKMASSPSCASTWHGKGSKSITCLDKAQQGASTWHGKGSKAVYALVWTELNRVWADGAWLHVIPPAAAVACKPQRRACKQRCSGGQVACDQKQVQAALLPPTAMRTCITVVGTWPASAACAPGGRPCRQGADWDEWHP